MLLQPLRVLGLAVLIAFAASLAAPRAVAAVPAGGVNPGEASYGTTLTLSGSGFGLAKPKVFLQSAAVKAKPSLKVLAFSDTTVVVLLNKKVAPGTWDVVVDPKGKLTPAVIFPGALAVRAPSFMALDPAEALPGATVTLHGQFLGTAKGSVKVGTKKAKVLAWSDTSATFVVPAKLAAGSYPLIVSNKLGTFSEPCALFVPGAGGTFAGCPDRVTAQLGANPFQASGFLSVFAFGVQGVPNQLVLVALQVGPPRVELQVVIPFDVMHPSTANIVGDAAGLIRVEQGNGPFDPNLTVWTTAGQGNDYAVVVTGAAGGKVSGNLQAQLVRVQGSAGDPTLNISNGTFRVTAGP